MNDVAKKREEKAKKITLQGYYVSLPDSSSPKLDFINEVSYRCKVSQGTVRNWIFNRVKPSKEEYMNVLSELTGIEAKNLFDDERN